MCHRFLRSRKSLIAFWPLQGRGDLQFHDYRKSLPETNFDFLLKYGVCACDHFWGKMDLLRSDLLAALAMEIWFIQFNFQLLLFNHGERDLNQFWRYYHCHALALNRSVMQGKVCIHKRYKFFAENDPPPFGTFPQSHLFWYRHLSLSITCTYHVDFVASVTRSACVKSTRKTILFLTGQNYVTNSTSVYFSPSAIFF